jgi:hypothetical protein
LRSRFSSSTFIENGSRETPFSPFFSASGQAVIGVGLGADGEGLEALEAVAGHGREILDEMACAAQAGTRPAGAGVAPETATARAAGLIVNFVDRFQTKGWAERVARRISGCLVDVVTSR